MYQVSRVCLLMGLLGCSASIYASEEQTDQQSSTDISKQTVTLSDRLMNTNLLDPNQPHIGTLLQVQANKYELELLKLQQEKANLLLEKEEALTSNRQDLIRLTAERDKLLMENEIAQAKLDKQLAKVRARKETVELSNLIREEDNKQHLDYQSQLLTLQNTLQEQRNRQEELGFALESARLQFEMVKLEYEQAKKQFEGDDLGEKIAERDQRLEWESRVNDPIEYLQNPVVDGKLLISDRRILLDGPIMSGSAAYITERIHFFNNKSTKYPIFLVIDNCPGGSVLEGARIIEAMQHSDAPVYVVVKSLAASMAAVITALSEKSYAYPNAIIAHHQIWGAAFGNPTQQKESLQLMKEWSDRLLGQVADKMGISLEEFVDKMYVNNSDGNWREFSDQAVALGWVDEVVRDIKEKSYTRLPTSMEPQAPTFFLQEQVDDKGQRYVNLPMPSALDIYHIYNPYGYYRW